MTVQQQYCVEVEDMVKRAKEQLDDVMSQFRRSGDDLGHNDPESKCKALSALVSITEIALCLWTDGRQQDEQPYHLLCSKPPCVHLRKGWQGEDFVPKFP